MIRHALILALLIPLGYHAQYVPAGPRNAVTTTYNACLISGWLINEGTGRTLNDVTVNANSALISNTSPTWGSNAGFPGSSWTVSAQGAQASSTTLTAFNGTTAFSIAAWISITGTTDQIILSNITNAGTYTGWELGAGTWGTGQLDFWISNTITTNAIQVFGSTNIRSTGKHYVVATYDGSKTAAGVKLYVDGATETVTTVANTLTGSSATATKPQLGTRPADGNTMSGILSSVAVYNCVLNATDIATYNARGPQVN